MGNHDEEKSRRAHTPARVSSVARDLCGVNHRGNKKTCELNGLTNC